jgi:hypothetical protein
LRVEVIGQRKKREKERIGAEKKLSKTATGKRGKGEEAKREGENGRENCHQDIERYSIPIHVAAIHTLE